jgi:hypothetical protein
MHDALSQVTSQLTLIPAYGRVYKCADEIIAGWKAGHDFKIAGGPYCSIRDYAALKRESSSVYITDGGFEYVRVI